ncbi:MAG: FKBP-type peptidyl-prolyl cis-trans isomerase [Akkermansiaceae bacterium]|nr:FKBP-type peptidyl-prolyl cis-trans isomerase [Akkermansiaceae bacterium]
MELRHLVPIVVLVGAVLFLVFRSDEKAEDDQSKSEKARSEQAVPSSYSSSGENDKVGRRVVSKRVLRDKPKVITTESGLRYEILTEGEGDSPGPSSRVKVHYSGTLADGTVFDSSRERGQPAVFGLNQVIKGWTEGLQLMKPGALYRFVIPSDLAYGDSGAGSAIPAGATLTFEVELISIEKP